MDFRNRKSATDKSTSKRTSKTNKTFVKLAEVEGVLQIEDGVMWLKSGKYDAPSVSIEIEPGVILSDWSRKITLRHCDLVVEENEKGYPELIISSDSGDMPF